MYSVSNVLNEQPPFPLFHPVSGVHEQSMQYNELYMPTNQETGNNFKILAKVTFFVNSDIKGEETVNKTT